MTGDGAATNNFFQHFELINSIVDQSSSIISYGRVSNIKGLVIEVKGLSLALGKMCKIIFNENTEISAEVVGFSKDTILIMPYENIIGIAKGMYVVESKFNEYVQVGEGLLGRVVDSLGNPLDGEGIIKLENKIPMYPKPLNPLKRNRISEVLDVGVRAINTCITVCKGQRMGIFAESGIGKSVLLGMMTKFTEADVVVVALIGERGREVKEFIEEIIGPQNIAKSVIVAAAADHSPLMKITGATYATAIAEFFRSQGKNVLLIIDSLTRYAQAYRELTLSTGEMPTAKGYTPSVFAKLSQLIERSGPGGISEKGSITAFYTILIEGEEISDPIGEHVRSLIDGHIILSRSLAEEGHYPAINIEKSVSRLMHSIVPKEQQDIAQFIRKIISSYNKHKDMITIGMYQSGTDPYTDCAIKHWTSVQQFLTQGIHESSNMKSCIDSLSQLLKLLRD